MIGVFRAQLVGLFVEASLYGVYLVAFGACLLPRTVWHDRPGRMRLPLWKLPWATAFVTAGLFVLVTLHLAIALVQLLILSNDEQTTPIRNWVTTVKSMTSFTLLLLGDGAFVYRCWIVYSKSWLIITFPLVLWIAQIASVVLFLIAQTVPSIPVLAVDKPTVITIWSLTIATTIYITTMITYRIWIVDERSPKFGVVYSLQGHILSGFVLRIVIESALLYTCSNIFAFFTTVLNTNVAYIATTFNPPLIGISFNLILIRLALYPAVETEELSKLTQHHDVTTGVSDTTNTRDQESEHIELASLNESDGAAVNGKTSK